MVEGLSAHVTAMPLLLLMRQLVVLVVPVLVEAFATEFTCVRLETRMNA